MLLRPQLVRPAGAATFALLTFFLCSGFASPTSCNDQNNNDHLGRDVALAGVGVGVVVVGAIVLVHENNVHHNVTGCAFQTPEGLELRTDDGHSYKLAGDTASLKEGDKLALHGQRMKKDKHASGDQVFEVSKLKKDKGPCTVPATPAPAKAD